MTEKDAMKMIEASLGKLKENEMIARDAVVSGGLPLLGPGSPLDSIGFVVFLTDLEERISIKANKEIYLFACSFACLLACRPACSLPCSLD